MVFLPEFNLANLDGTNGFAINGIDAGDLSGCSVSNAVNALNIFWLGAKGSAKRWTDFSRVFNPT